MALVGPLLYAAGAGNLGPRATTLAAAFHRVLVDVSNTSRVGYLRSAGDENSIGNAIAPIRAHVALEESLERSVAMRGESGSLEKGKREDDGEIAVFAVFTYFVQSFVLVKGENQEDVAMAVFYVVVWYSEVYQSS